MLARYDWQENQSRLVPSVASDTNDRGEPQSFRSVRTWLLLYSLTSIFGLWLAYRWLLQPAWIAWFPPFAREMLELAEVAGAVTLGLVWAVLWLRQMQPKEVALPPVRAAQLYQLSPRAFETYVASLFRSKGYYVRLRGRSGDHGVDLELKNGAGKRAIVQCKRYQNTVGEEVVRELYGTLIHERVSHAFLVTTAEVSEAAREWSQGKPITLIDGDTLEQIIQSLDRGERKRA